MAKKNDTNREELEQLTATESFFDRYKKVLIIGASAIVVIVLGVIIYQKFVTEPKIEASQDAYWNAFYEYQNGDSTELAYEGNENFAGFIEVADEYDGTPGGEIANYALATHAMEKQQWEEALGYLEACDFEDVMLGTLVIGMMGDCYVEMGEYATAAEKFEEAAAREENEFTSPMFLKKAGLVYEELGDRESAIKAYQKIKDNWSLSVEANDIDKYIAKIQS
ncbi:MAG: tetratricopeptide repeat protein [Crocinitomicaceae bacterium]|nr:tetratricopeptide repeat protein [Crocinitomicaceae bacterium]